MEPILIDRSEFVSQRLVEIFDHPLFARITLLRTVLTGDGIFVARRKDPLVPSF